MATGVFFRKAVIGAGRVQTHGNPLRFPTASRPLPPRKVGAVSTERVVERTRDDVVAEEEAQRTFSTSVVISAIRCLLTYVLFPFVAPIVGIASGVGSTIGVVTSIVGIAANVWSIHRFHSSNHPWRWPITAINVGIIVLLSILLVIDLTDLL